MLTDSAAPPKVDDLGLRLLARLVRGFTADEIAQGQPGPPSRADVEDSLSRLVRQGLIARSDEPDGRYRALPRTVDQLTLPPREAHVLGQFQDGGAHCPRGGTEVEAAMSLVGKGLLEQVRGDDDSGLYSQLFYRITQRGLFAASCQL